MDKRITIDLVICCCSFLVIVLLAFDYPLLGFAIAHFAACGLAGFIGGWYLGDIVGKRRG